MAATANQIDESIPSRVERDSILDQLNRLTESRYFNLSRRLPLFLRYVVEKTIAGEGRQLKERTLGIDVFGKDSDYDPAGSSVVRVTAAEVRKRLALYYQDAGHGHEIRILLPVGTYVPDFHFPDEVDAHSIDRSLERLEQLSALPACEAPLLDPASSQRRLNRSRLMLLSGAVAIGVVVCGVVAVCSGFSQRVLSDFWQPVLCAKEPVLILLAGHESNNLLVLDASDPTHKTEVPDKIDTATFDDLMPVVSAAGFLRMNGARYEIQDSDVATLTNLKRSPTILVGAYCNAWTMRLLKPLRFHFENDASMARYWIVDEQSQKPVTWVVDRAQLSTTRTYRDYAIIARFMAGDVGQPVVVVAGIGGGGTIEAGELVTNTEFLKQVMGSLPGGRMKRNFEAVISTQVINGRPGIPRLESSYAW